MLKNFAPIWTVLRFSEKKTLSPENEKLWVSEKCLEKNMGARKNFGKKYWGATHFQKKIWGCKTFVGKIWGCEICYHFLKTSSDRIPGIKNDQPLIYSYYFIYSYWVDLTSCSCFKHFIPTYSYLLLNWFLIYVPIPVPVLISRTFTFCSILCSSVLFQIIFLI